MRAPDVPDLLARARTLASNEDIRELEFAALCLRMAIEAITYEKLSGYSKYVPSAVVDGWQPAHAMRMLVQFEPAAATEPTIYVGMQPAKGVPPQTVYRVGECRTFDARWLQKNYNKLGSYLHYPHAKSTRLDLERMREDLLAIASEIQRVVEGEVSWFTMDERLSFDCRVCGQPSAASLDGIRLTGRAVCVAPDCGAVHQVVDVDGRSSVRLVATEFECMQCGETILVEDRKLAIGLEFDCPSCRIHHTIVDCSWGYVPTSSL